MGYLEPQGDSEPVVVDAVAMGRMSIMMAMQTTMMQIRLSGDNESADPDCHGDVATDDDEDDDDDDDDDGYYEDELKLHLSLLNAA